MYMYARNRIVWVTGRSRIARPLNYAISRATAMLDKRTHVRCLNWHVALIRMTNLTMRLLRIDLPSVSMVHKTAEKRLQYAAPVRNP